MDRAAPADPLVGQLLDGRYRVGARIARGGMATVYEATDLRLDRLVALKVMPHALAEDEEFAARFVREARAAARLTHPNVVAVYDQGDDAGTVFLAMEYVPGRRTLRDVLRAEAPLPPRRALALFEPVLEAIAAAHESGIVHRDVKPENVLLDPRGRVKVTDFGLARAISSATTATATGGVLMGTVAYLAPEIVTDGSSDARSDVYALGVLLYEMLTGVKPHPGESPIQVAYKHVHDDVPPPSAAVEGIPPYLDAFVARATARRRDLRPADAHVMLQQLRRVRHAVDHDVDDDRELTDDLTPTIAVRTGSWEPDLPAAWPAGGPPPGAAVPTGRPDPVDEVFDFTAYDDFSPAAEIRVPAGTAHPGPSFVPAARHGHNGDRTTRFPAGVAARAGDTARVPEPSGATAAALHPGPPPPAAGRTRRRRRRGGWIAFLLVLLLAGGAAAGGWWYGVARYQSTPDVVGMPQAAARDVLEGAGLTFTADRTAYSESIPAGRVVDTDPGPGEDVLPGDTVAVTVSRGPERHQVPDVAGMTAQRAEQALESRSLRPAVRKVWHARVPPGDVVRPEPKAGISLAPDTRVTLVVSRGPRPIPVRDHAGDDADAAVQALESAGLVVRRVERHDPDVPAGVVIAQRPSQGTAVAGDPIRLVVSLGPPLVAVPNVDSYGVQQARSTLEEAGFTVEVRQNSPYFGLGFVVDQSPGADQAAPRGSTVVIHVV